MPRNTGAGSERSTIVVANALGAQQWEIHLSAAQIAGGAAAWATPPLTTYAAWLDGLWTDHGGDSREPLTVGQSVALWRRVLAESSESAELIGQAGAAEWAADAWQLLYRWRLDPVAQGAYPDQLDYRAFLSWCRSYRERLEGHGWLDRAELEPTLATRPLGGKACFVAADLVEPYPSRTALFAQLDAYERTVTATTPPTVAATQRAARLADSTDELRAAFGWAARRLAEQPAARVAIVVPDSARRHAEIERLVATALGDEPRPVASSAGRTLGAVPAVGAAFDALTLLAPRTSYAAFGRWLRSPFFAAAAPEGFARAKLDRQLRAEVVSQLPFATAYRCGLKELLDAQTPQSAAALAAALTTLGAVRSAVPSRWAHLFTRTLAAMGWQAPAARAALLGWHGSLDELARLTPILGDVTLDAALAELERILGRPAPAVLPVSGVHVLGGIGDVGPGYAGVWVTGLTDAAWPEPPHGNPLVPLAVQREHAMPYCSPRDAEERSARAFDRLVQRVPELVVSWPARVYDYETEPSPAIRNWPLLTAAEIDGVAPSRPLGGGVARETVTDPGPPLAATYLPGGTGALGRQARCPLRAFCQDRLGARELEPLRFGLSARLRGIATHRAAELLLRDLPPQSEIARREGAVAASAEQALARSFGRARASLAELFALEAEQLERVLAALLRAEVARAPFRVLAVEQRSEGALGRWTLTARVDRIDELADGSIAIVDYKTSERATSSDWFAPRLRDAQVPLYACHATGRVAAAVVARLTPSITTYSGFWHGDAFPGRPNRFAQAQAEDQVAVWRAQLLELATELAGGDTRIFHANCEDAAHAYAPLTRVFEQLALARGAAARW
jgi:probable DNA repair protein